MGKSTHPSHPHHKLELKSYKKPYRCDGCRELGFGARYRCEQCDFDLHKDCMLANPIAHHDFFKNCTFKFLHQPPQECSDLNCQHCKRYCDACAKPILGFVYHCEEKGWDLHPSCRNLTSKLSIEGVKFKLSDKVISKCIWCKKKNLEGSVPGIRGWCYVSKCKEYVFHVNCATDQMMQDLWRNGAYSDDDDDDDDNNLVSLENLELPVQSQLRGNRGRGSKFIKMVKLVFKAIVGILLGDPTVLFTGLLYELITN